MMKKLAFVLLFVALVFLATQVKLSTMWGASGQYFTLYEFLGPLPAAFLGPVFGAAVIIIAKSANMLISGSTWTLFDMARVFTMVFAAWYFASYKKNLALLAVPLICMALFILNPIGGQAWYYSLYWLIPVVAFFAPDNLLLRSLGASFMAHAVGSVAFLYSIQTVPQLWIALIPVVAIERFVFAVGVAAAFVLFNTVLNKFFSGEKALIIEKNYAIAKF